MSENTNLVKTWAENIKADAECALKSLESSTKYEGIVNAISHLSEIKGSCEAIIAAVGDGKQYQREDHSCQTCKYNSAVYVGYHCISCRNGGGMIDMWCAK